MDPTRRLATSHPLAGASSARLVVVGGPDQGKQVVVQSGTARVGSAPKNTLALGDPAVSRLHCELRFGPEGIRLADCGSTNGTWIGGVSIGSATIPLGTVVTVGESHVRVEPDQAASLVLVSSATSFGELLGASREMRLVYAILERVAPTEVTVLIQGETGTGKDVAARAIHAASRRARGPFVPVDCSTIPESLFESELFGHVKGAFTGATGDRAGAFEEASGGTLFLDEIGELPLGQQAKLLRAIETRAVRPVGGARTIPVDVRVIAATNRPLARAVNEGTFREDLYYRLAVVEVTMPPLRARAEDVPELARHFLARLGITDAAVAADLGRRLGARAFPGNVRELRNFVERSVALGFLPEGAAPAPPPTTDAPRVPVDLPLRDARDAWTASFEAAYVTAMLERTGGNVTRAAELSGVSRRFFQRLRARATGREPGESE